MKLVAQNSEEELAKREWEKSNRHNCVRCGKKLEMQFECSPGMFSAKVVPCCKPYDRAY